MSDRIAEFQKNAPIKTAEFKKRRASKDVIEKSNRKNAAEHF